MDSSSKSHAAKSSGTKMTTTDVRRIQRATAKQNGGQVKAGSFPARAASAAEKNARSGVKAGQDKPKAKSNGIAQRNTRKTKTRIASRKA